MLNRQLYLKIDVRLCKNSKADYVDNENISPPYSAQRIPWMQ